MCALRLVIKNLDVLKCLHFFGKSGATHAKEHASKKKNTEKNKCLRNLARRNKPKQNFLPNIS